MGSKAWKEANAEKVREYWRAWYYRNRDRVNAAKRRRRSNVRNWLQEYKASLVCIDCAESHPATLDFHHLDADGKEFSVGDAVQYRWSKQRILDEIAKCVVLCANCHRKRHWSASINQND